MCPNPYLVRTRPPLRKIVEVPCGRCVYCRRARSREWSTRLIHQLATTPDALFVTLTIDDDNILANDLSKRDLQLYLKRLRKGTIKTVKYYAIGDYGDKTGRAHYHLIIFGLNFSDQELVKKSWTKGYVDVGTVTVESIRYVTHYIIDAVKYDYTLANKQKPFALLSKGLGLEYASRNTTRLNQRGRVIVRGTEVSVPRYYIKKGLVTSNVRDELKLKREEELQEKFEESGLSWPEFCREEKTRRLQNALNIAAKAKNRSDKL